MPFLTRFRTAWRSRPRSISISGTFGSISTRSVSPWRVATGRTNSASSSTRWLIDSSSKCGLRKPREREILLGQRVERGHLVANRAHECPPPHPIRRRPAPARCPASISALSSMALIGLRTSWATLSDSRPTVAMRSATRSSSGPSAGGVSVPVSSSFSRSTSPRARRSRSATRPRVTAGRPASTDEDRPASSPPTAAPAPPPAP